jgi:endoglucanase
MLIAVRDHHLTHFQAEARYGAEWLLRMWNDTTQTLIYQVGIGDGSSALHIAGDHDFWRLPEADDTLQVTATDPNYYVRYRPAFREAAAGSQVSPNLAGRLAADFALCSQVFRASDVAFANTCLLAAEHVFALARTGSAHPSLITASPSDYYPESSWRDDMELGATELYYAVAGMGTAPANLPISDPNAYLTQAGSWANAFLTSSEDGSDSLNLYDVSALAHDELVKAIRLANPTGMAVTEQDLLADMHDQLNSAGLAGQHDPYALAAAYSNRDAMPHALGLAVTASMYEELSGDATFKAFGLHQRDTVLGANPWGTSFVVGAGAVFPRCVHHQIANLSGALDGTSPILLGAVLDGPSDPAELAGLSLDPNDGHRACPAAGGDAFAAFSSADVAYKDDVADYPSVEPALDYSALSILLFARQ